MADIVSIFGRGFANPKHLFSEMLERADDMEHAIVIYQPKDGNVVVEASNELTLSQFAFAVMAVTRAFNKCMDT